MLLLLASSVAVAQGQPSLDDLLNLTPPAGQGQAPPKQPGDAREPGQGEPAGAVPVDDEVARLLTGEQPGDVFEQAVVEMGSVAQRLAEAGDSGVGTQRAQEQILAKLDRVIAMAKDQQMGQSGGSGSSGGQPNAQEAGSAQNQGRQPGEGQGEQPGQGQAPGQEGRESTGDGGGGAAAREAQLNRTLEESRSEWGNLPPRLRDEVMEGVREKFSPVYRELTEAYYRRLAEEGR